MGQKVNPKIFRTGYLYQWDSKWFSKKDYPKFLQQDVSIKKFLSRELKEALVSRIDVERSATNITVIIYSAKPGVVIGRGGKGIDDLKKKVQNKFLDKKITLNINIKEVTDPSLSAELIVQSMIADLEKRMPYRRVMKQIISRIEKTQAKGIKVKLAGRLNGAEIARSETLGSGSLPLHTLRADIDYAQGTAATTYGVIGVKAWVYKGEKFAKSQDPQDSVEVKPVAAKTSKR